MKYNKNGNWKIYWGEMPLPKGAEALGTIKRDNELTAGALIRLHSGVYVQGNAGGIRQLNQEEIEGLIARFDVASAFGKLGGSSRSEAKRNASRENGKLGGRPRKTKNAE